MAWGHGGCEPRRPDRAPVALPGAVVLRGSGRSYGDARRIVDEREGTKLLWEALVAGILFPEVKDRATHCMDSEAQGGESTRRDPTEGAKTGGH